MCATTSKPPSRRDRAESVPPSDSARSVIPATPTPVEGTERRPGCFGGSFRIVAVTASWLCSTSTSVRTRPAWRATFVNDSWMILCRATTAASVTSGGNLPWISVVTLTPALPA